MTGGRSPSPIDRVKVIERDLVVALVFAHLIGAAVAALLLIVVLPAPEGADAGYSVGDASALAAYLAIVIPGIVATARRWTAPLRRDARRGALGDEARAKLLGLPGHLVVLYALGWGGAAILFALLDVRESPLAAMQIGLTVALAGACTSAIAYLVADLILRPVLPLALEGAPADHSAPGVTLRFVLTWALGTGVPVAGVVLSAGLALFTDVEAERVAITSVVLGVIALATGFGATLVAARSVSLPIRRVREVLRSVEGGDLEVSVAVDDASEVGELQAGVNQMVAGLRERERLRDLFGRHVGHDVAERALREGADLVGEEREAGVLFVDVIGSTSLAATRPPGEVVALLNAFFAVVVAAAAAEGGWVNKFDGDGALCVFGAPAALEDPAGAALRCAVRMHAQLVAEVPDLDAGIGVSAGVVVAGNIGAQDRFEYTVIGDPVNEAARLTELAKGDDTRVLASGAAIERASSAASAPWVSGDEVQLRGRTERTRTAHPLPRAG